MLNLSRNQSMYAQVLDSSYARYLSKFGSIREICITENYGQPMFDRDMHIMMHVFGHQFTVSRYIVGRKPSYCVEFGWNIFSQYSSQCIEGTAMYNGIEEVMIHILGLAYDADIDI